MKSFILLLSLLLAACGGEKAESPGGQSNESGLTAEQLEHGIGPVKPFDPGPIDPALAEKGQEIFAVKCTPCHKIEERYIGPALADVTTRRSPAYVLNMVLNPEEMIQKHPEARKLFGEFMTPMANQHLTQEEARAVLDYLRQQAPAEAQ